ncbi:MAG: extracellular solute-binding protein, partial [Candidatus Binatia bacterium]
MIRNTSQALLKLGLILVTVIAMGTIATVVRAQPVNLESAKKEGRVVIYGTVVPQVMTLIEKGFADKYGIKTEYWRADATKVIDRVLTEWRAGKPGFDVVIGARGPLALGKPDGVYAKFSPVTAASFPAKFTDPDGQLIAWRVTPVGVLFNTELVKSADVPKTLDDLLDSKWQGKIAMPDPSRHASTAQYLWNLEQVKGKTWMEFVKSLAKQKPLLLESYSTVPNTIVRGESSLGISYIQYTVQTKGPISFSPTTHVFADPSDVALSAKAANPNAAKVLIDYL